LKIYDLSSYRIWKNFLSENETLNEFMERINNHNFIYFLYLNKNYKEINCCKNCKNHIEYGEPDGSWLCCNLKNTFMWKDIDYTYNAVPDDLYDLFIEWIRSNEVRSEYICDAYEFKKKGE
jgi:hypothetical protein